MNNLAGEYWRAADPRVRLGRTTASSGSGAYPGVEVHVLDAADVVGLVHEHADIDGLALNTGDVVARGTRGIDAVPAVEQLHVLDSRVRAREEDGPGEWNRCCIALLLRVADGKMGGSAAQWRVKPKVQPGRGRTGRRWRAHDGEAPDRGVVANGDERLTTACTRKRCE